MSTVTGSINLYDFAGYVRSLERVMHVCSPAQTVKIVFDPKYRTDTDFNTGDGIILYEQDVLTFTGHVTKIVSERPSHDFYVEGDDEYGCRAMRYFISDKLVTGYNEDDTPIVGYTPQDTDYWIAYLCSLCGLSYSIQSGNARLVPIGTTLGLRTVHESLLDILTYASMYVHCQPDGTARFERIRRDTPDFVFHSGTGNDNLIEAHQDFDDSMVRTVIKVYGGFAYKSGTGKIFASASTTLSGITPDRTAAIASPLIETQAEAQRVADYMLNELGVNGALSTATARIVGDPTVYIGKVARISDSTMGIRKTDAITSVEALWNKDEGYVMEVTIGERCPRLAGFSFSQPVIYAGTSGSGVFRSDDAGATWSDFNTGLTASKKYVNRVAANSFDEVMAIVNGSLYYNANDGNNWQLVTLPAPQNMSGDGVGHGTLIAVDAEGLQGQFAVLTSNGNSSSQNVQKSRSWVYESSGSSTWTSTQLQDTSGSSPSWAVYGLDLSTSLGLPQVVATSGSVYATVAFTMIKGDMSRKADQNVSYFVPPAEVDPSDYGIIDYYATASVSGFSPFRVLTVTLHLIASEDYYVPTVFYKSQSDRYLWSGGINAGAYPTSGFGAVSQVTGSTNQATLQMFFAETTVGTGVPFAASFALSAWSKDPSDSTAIYVRNGEQRQGDGYSPAWYANTDVVLTNGYFEYIFA